MSEIVNASAVRFDDLLPIGDGYTLLSINGKVHKSDKLLSEMVQSAVDKQVEDKLDTTAFSTVSGNFLTAHQSISADKWNSCYETVSANSGIWGTEHDWITEIKDASANAFNEASAWVEEQNYITGVDLSNYYTKNETSSKNELNLAFDTKQDKGDYYSASNPSGFLTAHQSLDDYAKKEWIEEKYYNVDEINDFLDEKYDTSSFEAVSGTFLTAHQDLSNYYTKDETSGSQQLADAFNTKQNILTFAGENNTITAINSSAIGGGSNNSWKEWSEDHNSSGDENSIYIGENITANNSGYIFGNGLNRENDTNNGMIITMSNDLIDENYKTLSSYRDITGTKYIDDDGKIVYSGINFTANEIYNNSATQAGISIGRAVTAEASIAISPKWNGLNTNDNGLLGTIATNESIAIGENIAAHEGSITLGKNGLSSTNASIGIGRMGVANNASILVSNDLNGNKLPFSGKLWAYYDEAEEKYKPFTGSDNVIYKNYQTINNQIYNKNTSSFESINFYTSPIYVLFLNTWNGNIGYLTSITSWGRDYFSGYYDENNDFIKVNSSSEVPATATLIRAFSVMADKGFGQLSANNIFTTYFYGDYVENYYNNPYLNNYTIHGYILGWDSNNKKYLYESCLNKRNTSNPSLYNFLSQYEHLSGYINENSLNGIFYENIKYDPETNTIFNTTENIVDYWLINEQKVYPNDITEQIFTDLDDEKTYSDANSISIGAGLSSYGDSIAINAGTDVSPYYSEYSNPMYCCSGKIGNMLTGNSNYTAYLSNSYSANKEIKSKNNIVTACGKSIVLGADGKNINAYGNSIAIGNHDINVTGKSVGIGNNIYSLNQSIVINQNAFGGTPSAINQSIVIGGGGSWAQDNSFIFGESNSANKNAYIFGRGNLANGSNYAIGEYNYISTGKSFALGYSNYINGSTEACTVGYRNYVNGGSMQNMVMGYDNYMSVGGYEFHLIGNKNSATCGNVYGSVLGNLNYLSHGNSLLAIHGNNNSALGSLGEANIFGAYNVVGGGGNRISVIGFDNGRNAPASYGNYDGVVFGNGNNWNGNGFRGSIIGLYNNISGISYTDMSILGNDNFVSSNEAGIILGNRNNINSYQNNTINSTRNIIIGNENNASGYASMNSVLLGTNNRVYEGQNITIGESNHASNQSFVLGYNNSALTGDNLCFGVSNEAEYESISIGNSNNTYGHSISLGWRNKTESSYAGHSILLGVNNSATCQYEYLMNDDGSSIDYVTKSFFVKSNNNFNEDKILITNYINQAYNIIDSSSGLTSIQKERTKKLIIYIILNYQEFYYNQTVYNWLYNTFWTFSEDLTSFYNAYYAHSQTESDYNNYFGVLSQSDANAINGILTNIAEIESKYSTEGGQTIVIPDYILTSSDRITTNNFIVGADNTANNFNSFVFGSNNLIPSADISGNDGFTLAYGIGNLAIRNYDMAIGLNTVASGGENIAIGAPQKDPYYGLLWNTNAIGYRNIAIRSNVSGIGNIAFESNFEGKGINNVILNSQITGTTDDDDSDYPYARNDIRYSKGILNVGNNFTDNVIKTTTANIDCKGYCVNNIIQNSYVDVSSNENIVNNFINTTTASGETSSFRHNVIFFSDIDVTSGDYNFGSTNQNQNVSNFLVGVSAKNVNGTFAFADYGSNSLQEVERSVSLGDNHLNRVRGSFVFGGSNIVTNAEMSFVAGNGNGINIPCSSYSDVPASMEYILGSDNTINFTTITSTNARNKIFGNSNVIYAETDVTDNVFIGNGNRLIYFTDVPDNHIRIPDIPSYDYTHDTYALYRNVILGSNNAISQCISNGFIAGDSNTIMTTNTGYEKNDSLYDSSIILGFGNVAYNGSKQLAIGEHNNISGHFAYALGEDLSAQDFQMVVGKYNAPVPKTERCTSGMIGNTLVELENSGVVFAIGNGRLKAYEKDGEWYIPEDEYNSINEFDEDYIERSNAMIVSANGTVSAGDFEISGCKLSDIIDVVTLLKNKPASGQPYIMGLDNSGNLTWMNV